MSSMSDPSSPPEAARPAAESQRPVPPLSPRIFALGLVAWLGVTAWWSVSARAWFAQQTFQEAVAEVDDVRYHRGGYDRLSPSCSTADDRGPRTVVTTYSFAVNGKHYTSTAYDHRFESELFCTEEDARARIAELERTRTVTVAYDPNDPRIAVQQKQDGSEVIFVYTLLLGVGMALVWLYLRQGRLQRAHHAALSAYLDG